MKAVPDWDRRCGHLDLAGRGEFRGREESLALPGDRDACATGEVQVLRDLPRAADVLGDTEANDLRHPGLVPVPVDLEAVGIPHVEVVGGDEVETHTVRVRADARDDRGQETGLRVCAREDLFRGDFELVT